MDQLVAFLKNNSIQALYEKAREQHSLVRISIPGWLFCCAFTQGKSFHAIVVKLNQFPV
jgi:hypothetical protein